jgi:hypothetical protein
MKCGKWRKYGILKENADNRIPKERNKVTRRGEKKE